MLENPIPEPFSANVIDLGVPKRFFPIRKMNRVGNLVIAIIFLVAALVAFLIGIYNAVMAYQVHGLAVAEDKLVASAIIALILFFLACLIGWSAYVNWNRGVVLYERGFAIRDRKGIQNWHWTDINSIKIRITRHYTNGIYTGTSHEYTLINKQDQKLVINDAFSKVQELAEAIEQNLYPLLYGPAAEQYNNGHLLVFGPVNIDRTGVHIGKRNISWQDVKEISLKQGMLRVNLKNGGLMSNASVPVASIPNLHVLLAIINQVVGLKTV
jgi:hypothetical protein